MAGCGSAEVEDSSIPPLVEDAPPTPRPDDRSEDLRTLVDFLVSDVDDDVCYEISWNEGSRPPTSGCLGLRPPVVSPVNLVLDLNVSGEDMSEFVSFFVLVDPDMNVTRVTQFSQDAEWQQTGRGLVVRGQSLLGATTQVRFELDGRIGMCLWSRDGEVC